MALLNGEEFNPDQKPRNLFDKMRLMYLVMESVFFEKEALNRAGEDPKKPVIWKGLLIACGFALAQGLFLLIWVARDSRPLGPGEISAITVSRYYRHAASSGNISGMLISPLDNEGIPVPPLYYWALMPVSGMPSPEHAAILLNIIYLALLASGVYMLVRRFRTDEPALLAALVAVSLPFVLHCEQRISPDLMLMAFVACSYAAYIWSDEFRNKGWTYAWGFFCILGSLSSWVFPICILPLAARILYGMLNIVTGKQVERVFIAWAVFYILIIVFNAASLLMWISKNTLPEFGGISSMTLIMAVEKLALNAFAGVKWYCLAVAGAMQLPFLLFGLLAGLWLMAARFAPFPPRKDILFWVVAPLLAFCVLQIQNANYILPSLAAFAVAIGVMTPSPARKAVGCAFLVFSLFYQSGLLGSAHINMAGQSFALWESQKPVRYGNTVSDMLFSINRTPHQDGNLEIAVSSGVPVSPSYLNWKVSQLGFNGINFSAGAIAAPVYPELVLVEQKDWDSIAVAPVSSPAVSTAPVVMAGAGVAVSTAAAFGKQPQSLPGIPWLHADSYSKAGEYALENGGTVALLALKRVASRPLPDNASYSLAGMDILGYNASEVRLELGPWNDKLQSYDWAKVDIGMLSYGKVDIYGVRLLLKGFAFSLPDPLRLESPALLKLSGVKILSASITKDAFLELLQHYYPQFSNLHIELSPGSALFGASYNNTPFAGRAELILNGKTGDLILLCKTLDIAGFTMPGIITRQLVYVIRSAPQAGRPFSLEVGPVAIRQTAIEISDNEKTTAAPAAVPAAGGDGVR
jgi:4-amino-4-deoxy-L-arabinose transferase-like glycosyltransferase